MRTKQEITAIANGLYAQVTDGIAGYSKERVDLVKAIMTEDLDSAYDKVGVLSRGIQAIMRGAVEDSVSFPGFLTRLSTRSEGKLTSLSLTVSSKLKATRKFKLQRDIEVTENLVNDMASVYIDALFDALYTEMAAENVEDLNMKLDKICNDNEVAKRVQFEVGTETGRVVYIDDDTLILRADVEKAMAISELGIMAEGTEYDQLVSEDATKAFVDVMQTVLITPEILKKRIRVVDFLVDIRTKKHASKIIRETVHKQAIYLKSASEGVGYFSDSVDGVNVFALLKLNESGEYEYVLHPFDTDKLVAVDVDVIGMLKK